MPGGGVIGQRKVEPTNCASRLAFLRSELGLQVPVGLPVRLMRISMVIIRIFEDLLLQMLVEQMMKNIHYAIGWLSVLPWEVWFA